MKTFWLSWWDPVDGKPGLDTDGIVVWISGTRESADGEQNSCVALVVAESETAAWAKAERYYPGAATAERRFSNEVERGYRPNDRFPLNAKQQAMLKAAESASKAGET